MNGQALIEDLAALADIPAYKVRAMLGYVVKVIQYETSRGGSVALMGLGSFAGKTVRAKTIKNVIARRGVDANGKPFRKSQTFATRRKLVFIPKDSKKWIPRGMIPPT